MDLDEPERRYRLSTSPGKEFSGLHLVSLLSVGFKLLDPTIDPGVDLQEPYTGPPTSPRPTETGGLADANAE